MKIIIDINHPAHVHFFKNLYYELIKKGHNVIFTVTTKDINMHLIHEYKIPYHNLGSYGNSFSKKLLTFFIVQIRMLFYCLKYKPDFLIGIGSFRIAQVGYLLRKPSFVFEDTENSKEQIALYKPFATKIFTPNCFQFNIGEKQIRYSGYHELAYLHPNRFEADASLLNEIGLKETEPFFILRFITRDASHDIGHKGLTNEFKIKLVERLLKYGKVFISSEKQLIPELEPYKLTFPSEKIHHLIYFATMILGESATMSSEAAVLGVHSVFWDYVGRGYTDEEERKYELVYNFNTDIKNKGAELKKIEELLNKKNLREIGKVKQNILLSEKIDVTSFIIDEINKI